MRLTKVPSGQSGRMGSSLHQNALCRELKNKAKTVEDVPSVCPDRFQVRNLTNESSMGSLIEALIY